MADSVVADTTKAAAEVLKAVPVYQDAIQPVAQEVGKSLKTIGGVINVALSPLAAMVYGFEIIKVQLKERLEKKLSKTPPENIITPKLQLVGPLIDNYKYVHDCEDLSEMFVNLLAKAMDKDQVKKAHPSFVRIITELSPDEARLLKLISSELVLPKLDIKSVDPKDASAGFDYLYINFSNLGERAELTYPELTPSYLSNLERLNIISCPVNSLGNSYANTEVYKELEDHPMISALQEEYKKIGKEIETEKRIIEKTDFGKLFLNAVLTN